MSKYTGIANAHLQGTSHRAIWKREYTVEAANAQEATDVILRLAEDDAAQELEVWVPVVLGVVTDDERQAHELDEGTDC